MPEAGDLGHHDVGGVDPWTGLLHVSREVGDVATERRVTRSLGGFLIVFSFLPAAEMEVLGSDQVQNGDWVPQLLCEKNQGPKVERSTEAESV